MKRFSWFAFFAIFSAACLDDPDCFQLDNNVLGITFRVIGTGQGDSVRIENLNEAGEIEDIVVTSITTNLNYFKEEEVIEFRGPEQTNALRFSYTVKNQFISEDCGSSFELSDLRILQHNFDSARVVSSTPTKTGGTNIEIYRCPETDTLVIDFNQLYATTNGITVTNRRSAFISHPFETVTTNRFPKPVYAGRAARLKLPVDTTENEITYKFIFEGIEDSLVLSYDRVREKLYRPCGIQTFIRNLTYEGHTFDSVSFGLNADDEPVRSLQDPHITNIRVFDCPKTNLMQVGFKRGTASAPVTIKSITADHFEGKLLKDPITTATLQLPVDLASDRSIFYIQYQDDTMDTLNVSYIRSDIRLFNACENPVVSNLQEVQNLPDNITVVPAQTRLQFPPVTNVEISVD